MLIICPVNLDSTFSLISPLCFWAWSSPPTSDWSTFGLLWMIFSARISNASLMFSPVKAEVSMNGILKFKAVCCPSYRTQFSTDHSVVDQVYFIADQQDFHIGRSQISHLVHPLVYRLEAVFIIDTIHNQNSVGPLLDNPWRNCWSVCWSALGRLCPTTAASRFGHSIQSTWLWNLWQLSEGDSSENRSSQIVAAAMSYQLRFHR